MSNYYELYKLEQELDIKRQRSIEHTNWMHAKGRLRSLDDRAKELVRNLSSHTGYPKYYSEQIEIEFIPNKDQFKVYRLQYYGEGNWEINGMNLLNALPSQLDGLKLLFQKS